MDVLDGGQQAPVVIRRIDQGQGDGGLFGAELEGKRPDSLDRCGAPLRRELLPSTLEGQGAQS